MLAETSSGFRRIYGVHVCHLLWLVAWAMGPLLMAVYCLLTETLISRDRDRLYAYSFVANALGGLLGMGSTLIPCRSETLKGFQEDLRNTTANSLCMQLRRIMPCISTFGPLCVLSLVYWKCRVSWFADVPLTERALEPWWLRLTSISSYISFLGCGLPVGALALGTPWLFSRDAIGHFIAVLEGEEVGDWDQLAQEVHQLDQRLEELWAPSHAGMPWIFALFTCVLHALLGVETLLAGDADNWTLGTIYLVGGSLGFVMLLLSVSYITSACQNMRASSWSIAAAAQRYPSRHDARGGLKVDWMPAEERQAHDRFMKYVTRTQMGVEFFGVLVTFSLVTTLMVQLLIAIPTIYKILESIMRVPEGSMDLQRNTQGVVV